MHVSDWLQAAESELVQAGIGTARLDALVLLEDVASKNRAWLLAHPEFELSAINVSRLKNLLRRRVQHIPLAYVRGKTEFYGRTFLINDSVLEPRPESETMIDLLKKHLSGGSLRLDLPAKIRLADVGTGSGALGITAKLECPGLDVELLEVDPKAIEVAKKNVDFFTLNISIIESDLLANSSLPLDILLCNLPYVPDGFQINTAASHEPHHAIFGGPDGLDLYRKLFDQIAKLSNQPLLILIEAMPPQHDELTDIARRSGYQEIDRQNFIQVFI
jgi:release factor glutamine methyltransferase